MIENLLKFLAENIVFVIIGIGWLVSSLGGVLASAARKAERRRREAEQRGHAMPRSSAESSPGPVVRTPTRSVSRQSTDRGGSWSDAGGGSWADDHADERLEPFLGGASGAAGSQPPLAARQGRSTGERSPEDIAAEIRRVMGLETPRPPTDEATPADVRVQRARIERVVAPPRARRYKVKKKTKRDGRAARPDEFEGWLAKRELQKAATRAAKAQAAATPYVPRKRRRKAPLVDLRNPAKAIVMAEVLGRPRAEQEFRGGQF